MSDVSAFSPFDFYILRHSLMFALSKTHQTFFLLLRGIIPSHAKSRREGNARARIDNAKSLFKVRTHFRRNKKLARRR